MNKKNTENEETTKESPFLEQWDNNNGSVGSSSNLGRIMDLGENVRTKYFSNKIKLNSHNDLVRMAKLEKRNIATILEAAIECYKNHSHPDLK